MDSAEILARKESEVRVTASLLAHGKNCDDHAVQSPGALFTSSDTSSESHLASYCLSLSLKREMVYSHHFLARRKRPSSFLQSSLEVSAAGFSVKLEPS